MLHLSHFGLYGILLLGIASFLYELEDFGFLRRIEVNQALITQIPKCPLGIGQNVILQIDACKVALYAA